MEFDKDVIVGTLTLYLTDDMIDRIMVEMKDLQRRTTLARREVLEHMCCERWNELHLDRIIAERKGGGEA